MIKLTVEFDENKCVTSVEGTDSLEINAIVMGIGTGVGRAVAQAIFRKDKLDLTSINFKGVQATLTEYIEVGMAEEITALEDEEE